MTNIDSDYTVEMIETLEEFKGIKACISMNSWI